MNMEYRQVGIITDEHKDLVKDEILATIAHDDEYVATALTDRIFGILGLEPTGRSG